MNRLINWTVNRNGTDTPYSMSYDATLGNIISKSDLGAFTLKYGGEKEDGTMGGTANGALKGPHALTTITPNLGTTGLPANIPTADLNVTYTDFKKIATLTEGSKFYRLTYGTDDERRKSEYYANGLTQLNATLTRYQVGSYEEEINSLGNVRKIHYLSGAILIQNNGVDSLLYTYSDAQGSLIVLTDANGSLLTKNINGATVETGRFAYDPWGARRNPMDWTQKDSRTSWIINRGYTGHEHIDAFGIINMNGRVYDPLTAMFFSPDQVLTDAGNWLDYNRYSYCLNNPFRYTDPSGFSWWAENWQPVVSTAASIVVGIGVGIFAGPMGLVAAGMLGGSAGGFTSGALGTALSGGSFNQCLGAGMQGAFIGAIAGMAGGGAAQWMTSVIGSSFGGFAAGAAIGVAGGAAGGFVGGSLGSLINGASFGDGLMAGLKGAAIGAVAGGLIGGTIKGIDAVVNGKANFWDGHVNLDLSKGYGAYHIKQAIINKIIKGTYIKTFQGVRIYESESLGTITESSKFLSGGITLPEYGITVGQGVFSKNLDIQLLEHEFGHILQYRVLNYSSYDYYSKIAHDSMWAGSVNDKYEWTETWADYLSNDYFSHLYNQTNWDVGRFPIRDIPGVEFESRFGYPKPY